MKILSFLFNPTAKVAFFILFFGVGILTANAIGVLDGRFGNGGRVATDFGSDSQINAVVLQPDGKIVAVGIVSGANGDKDIALARYDVNGVLDVAFGLNGKVVLALSIGDDVAEAVAVQPDGKIVVAGRTARDESGQNYDFLVLRYNAGGVPDQTFGSNGVVTFNRTQADNFYALKICGDGKIIAAGDAGIFQPVVIAFAASGLLDSGFADQGVFHPSIPNFPILTFRALGLQPDGNIIVGGTALPNFNRKNLLIALKPDGTPAPEFGNQGLATSYGGQEGNAITDLAVQPDGKILTVGQVATRFTAKGVYDGSLSGGHNGDVAVLPNGKIINTASNYTAVASAEILYLETNTGKLINQSGIGINYVTEVIAQNDNKILAAGMRFADPITKSGQQNFALVRFSAVTSRGTRLFNSVPDAKTNIGVYRPEDQTFYILSSFDDSVLTRSATVSPTGIVPENFRSNYGLPACWGVSNENAGGTFYGDFDFNSGLDEFQWGASGDAPVGGDYDGDGVTDFAVFRPSNGAWYILNSSNNQFRAVQFGQAGDKLVPADYDHDGITDIAVFRPANGGWYVLRSADNNFSAISFGASEDVPLTGDYDGDGSADFVVFRPSNGTWYLLETTEGFRSVEFGASADQPVPGDYDGDGRHDIAIFRQGTWYILQSRDGFKAVQWGASGDVPIAVKY